MPTLGRDVVSVPEERDRYLDLIRGASIVMVVVGHWLVSQFEWTGHELRLTSSLGAAPELWPVTWGFQVIPLFFFVGGFANRHSWESIRGRGLGYASYVGRRLGRILLPTGALLVAGVTAAVGVGLAGGAGLGSTAILLQPLWFLGVYVVVVALAPLTLAWHRRWGWWAVVSLCLAAGGVDAVRLGLGVGWAAFVNVIVVWVLAHQFGYLYTDGELTRRRAAWLAVGGFAALCALIVWGPYPARMVGVPGDRLTNMNPPTAAVAALTVWEIGTTVLLRRWVAPMLRRPRVFAGVIAVNGSIMTIYLWHQAVLVAVARVALPLGLPQPPPATAGWWLTRPAWFALAGTLLALLALALRPIDRRAPPVVARDTRVATVVAGLAVGLLSLGLLALAATDVMHVADVRRALGAFDVSALIGLVCVGAAAWLMRGVRRGDGCARAAVFAAAATFALLSGAEATGLFTTPAAGAAGVAAAFAGALLVAGAGTVALGRPSGGRRAGWARAVK